MMSIDFWKFVRRQLQDGEPLFVAHVADHTRHCPGTTGAGIAVAEDGEIRGTIGGGILEANALKLARRVLNDGQFNPAYERLHHRKDAPVDDRNSRSGLICAGTQTHVYHLVRPRTDLETVDTIVEKLDNDEPGLVRIGCDGMSLHDGALPDTIESPYRFETSDEWEFVWQLRNWKRIAIVGGGHCGLALSRVMAQLGYTVTVIDHRPDVFTFTNNKYASRRLVVDDYSEVGELIDAPAWTHVVVMTCNKPADVRALYGVADGPFPYIGVMAAPAKLAAIRDDLTNLGVSQDRIDTIHGPVGLDIASDTPEEIAISVAAEILDKRRRLFPFTSPPEAGC